MRHRREPGAQPGFIVTYHGSEIGVVERIDVPDLHGSPTLHARGGIAGSLRYAIPASAVFAVLPDTRRVALDDRVTFEPEAVGIEGDVHLIATTAHSDSRTGGQRPRRSVPRTSSGFRVYADDGYLGEIETTLGGRVDAVAYLVIRVRHRLRTLHPVLPTRLAVECEPLDGIVVVAGTRRELRAFPEFPLPAE